MSKRVIAFDLGLNFGYSDGTMSGSFKVDNNRRMFSFYNKVLDLLTKDRVGLPYRGIVFEDACFQQGVAIYNFNAQKGILQLLAESLNLEFVGYPPITVKKSFTGNAKADKKEMMAKAAQVSKRDIKDHNEADAIGVYHTHLILGGK